MPVTFGELAYIRPDIDTLIKDIYVAREALIAAKDWKSAREAFDDFHHSVGVFYAMYQISEIRFTQDVRDPFYAKENSWLGKQAPRLEAAMHDFYLSLLMCPFEEELNREYGSMLIRKLRYQSAGTGDVITELKQEENRLLAQFQTISGTSRIPFKGKILNSEQLYPYKGDRCRETRKAAYCAEGAYFVHYREQLEEIFDALVKNRTAQARLLGFDDYTELSLRYMQRMDYGLKDIAYYREQVKKYWVPAVQEIKKMQQQRLGLHDFKGYDNLLYFSDYNPVPKGDCAAILEACRKMFHLLSQETAEFFDFLVEREMFDLASREGKAPGGYCACVDLQKSPFIFSNFNGTTMDIDVLIHESGHGFAAYEAYKNSIVSECQSASAEISETHSTAMELLTMPYHYLFFGEDADRYDLFLMERTLTYLPGGCAGDEFQTLVYQHPDMSSNDRHELWRKLTLEYEPHFADFDDIPLYSQGQDWLIDPQFFLNPLYLVDYGMARNISLQLFCLQQKNPVLAWKKYLQFVSFGGTKTYREAVREIGLENPLEGETVQRVIEPMLEWVRKQNEKISCTGV